MLTQPATGCSSSAMRLPTCSTTTSKVTTPPSDNVAIVTPHEILEAHIYRFLIDQGMHDVAHLCRFHFHGGVETTTKQLKCELRELIPPFLLRGVTAATTAVPTSSSHPIHGEQPSSSSLREHKHKHKHMGKEHHEPHTSKPSHEVAAPVKKPMKHKETLVGSSVETIPACVDGTTWNGEGVPSKRHRTQSIESHSRVTGGAASSQRRLHRTVTDEGEDGNVSWRTETSTNGVDPSTHRTQHKRSKRETKQNKVYDEDRPLFQSFQKKAT